MTSAKQETSIYNVMGLLRDWDNSSREKRRQILIDFIAQHQNKSGPEIELEMAQMASLFLARMSVWLKLTYMTGACLTEQLQGLHIFLSATSSHNYLREFLEHGGVLCLLEILGLRQSREVDKLWALKVLQCVANAGTKYKEIICESYGIRAVAECLAKSKSEETQEAARSLLQCLADGNPKFVEQVYKGLIGVLPCSSPKAQQMALQTLRVVQPTVGTTNRAIVERLLNLLQTLHLEVQSAAAELIRDLMEYDIMEDLLRGLVLLLRPTSEVSVGFLSEHGKDNEGKTDVKEKENHLGKKPPLPKYVQQAAAAKCLGILARDSMAVSEQLIQFRVVYNLLYAMGNLEYADSQRQASQTLEYFCRTFPIVDEHVREAMGQSLYDSFMTDSEALYVHMTPVQADVLLSNKVNIPRVLEQSD